MSINKHLPHLLVLPEDDANRQIANGFITNENVKSRAIQVLPPADGWTKLLKNFDDVHAKEMLNCPERRMVLLIDFDKKPDRLKYVQDKILENINDRVFILGVLSEPEKLKKGVGKSFEDIGEILAEQCHNKNYNGLWSHRLLIHNTNELNRIILSVRPFIF